MLPTKSRQYTHECQKKLKQEDARSLTIKHYTDMTESDDVHDFLTCSSIMILASFACHQI